MNSKDYEITKRVADRINFQLPKEGIFASIQLSIFEDAKGKIAEALINGVTEKKAEEIAEKILKPHA